MGRPSGPQYHGVEFPGLNKSGPIGEGIEAFGEFVGGARGGRCWAIRRRSL